MTGSDMVYNFQQLLESVSLKYKETERLNTWEILRYLNRTVDRYIKLKYLSGRSFKENVFKVASSPDDLSQLYTTATFTPTTTVDTDIAADIPNSYIVAVSDIETDSDQGMLAYIRSSSKITRTSPFTVTAQWMVNREIDYNQIDNIITTPFNVPILESPLVTILEGPQWDADADVPANVTSSLLIIGDSYTTISDVNVTFLREPIDIDMDGNDCELGSHLHEEIVKLAVSMYMDEYKLKLAHGPAPAEAQQ